MNDATLAEFNIFQYDIIHLNRNQSLKSYVVFMSLAYTFCKMVPSDTSKISTEGTYFKFKQMLYFERLDHHIMCMFWGK